MTLVSLFEIYLDLGYPDNHLTYCLFVSHLLNLQVSYYYSEFHVEHENSDSPASWNDLDVKVDPKLSDTKTER